MNGGKLVTIGAAVAVLVAIVAGLILTGSPATQRMLRLDEQRVSDLRRLSNGISRYYRDTGRLPASLESIVDGRILTSLPADPTTDEPYGYETTGTRGFRLCADFARAVEMPMEDEFWAHDAGPTCFDFDYTSLRLN